MQRSWLALALLAASACGDVRPMDDQPPPSVFIALDRDFAGYRSWRSTPLRENPMVEGEVGPPPQGFINREAQPGATAYPVGTIILKLVTTSDAPDTWPLFGMVKRGGGYNTTGAKDWEYFVFGYSASGAPFTLARGSNPRDSGTDNHGYGDPADEVTCNKCHAVAGADRYDSILSPFLQLAPSY